MSLKRKKDVLIEYGILIIVAFFIAMGLKFTFEPTKVSGDSMYPTLENEDKLLLNRFDTWFTKTDRGDIIVFEWEERGILLVKRVIGVAGDKVSVTKEGVFVNDKKLDEEYINLSEEMIVSEEIHIIVPEEKVFVMGDNRNHSIDSRAELGFVDEDEILGSYLLRYSK